MSNNRFLSDLIGTFRTTFRIATVMVQDAGGYVAASPKSGTGFVPVAMSALQLQGASFANHISITIASNPASNYTFNWPVADGTTGQVLTTDGAGNLSWSTVGTGSNQMKEDDQVVNWNSAATIGMYTPPANSRTERVIVVVLTAFDGTGAQLSVGVTGTPSRYMAATDNDLTYQANYEVQPLYQEGATPTAVTIFFTAATGGTQGVANVLVQYVNPSDV